MPEFHEPDPEPRVWRLMDCPRCHGSGVHCSGADFLTCPTCGGHGFVRFDGETVARVIVLAAEPAEETTDV